MDDPKQRQERQYFRAATEARAAREASEQAAVADTPVPVVTLTMEQLQELIRAATGHSGPAMTSDVAAAITEGLKAAREPIPENKVQLGISEMNPLGDHAHPRSALLKCAMWMGAIQDDEDHKVVRFAQYEPENCTLAELFALNMLSPMEARIQMMDGTPINVRVVGSYNQATDKLERLTIGYPLVHLQRKSQTKNMIPSIVETVYQLTGHDFRRMSIDDMKAIDAEHRKGNYVSRLEVAA